MHILTHTLTFMHHLACTYTRICMHLFTHTYTPHIHTNMQASLRTHIKTPAHSYLKTYMYIHTHAYKEVFSKYPQAQSYTKSNRIKKKLKKRSSRRRCCCVCLYNTGLFFLSYVSRSLLSRGQGTFRDRRVSQPRGGVVRHKAEGKWTENGREGRCRALSAAEERAIGNGERFRKLSRGFPTLPSLSAKSVVISRNDCHY